MSNSIRANDFVTDTMALNHKSSNRAARRALGEIDDFEWEVFSLSHNQAFMDYLAQARQRGKREGTISIEEVRNRLGIAPETNDAATVSSD